MKNIFKNIREKLKDFFIDLTLNDFNKKIPHLVKKNKPDKSIYEMSTEEFYEHLTNTGDLEKDSTVFFRFLLEYLITAYLDGDLTEDDVQKMLALENPYEMNRYLERAVRSAKMQGTLLEELMSYQEHGGDAKELYSMILPEYAYDQEKKDLKVKSFAELKNAVKDSMENLAEQKRLIELAKMQQAEQERLEEMRRNMLAGSPEIAELISQDNFQTDTEEKAYTSDILIKEVEQLKNKTVIRRAKTAGPVFRNKTEAEMSPSELIAYKRKMLQKLRQDMSKHKDLNLKT